MKTSSILILCALSATAAAEPWQHPRVDVEPAAYVLRGFSIHLGAERGRWLFSGGPYGFDLPALLSRGWDARLVIGASAFADRFLGAPGRGWVIGGGLGAQRYRATKGGATSHATTLFAIVRGGYEWHPWGRGFYLFPWAGAALTPKVAGDGDFAPYPVQPYAACDLGWRW